MNILNVDLHVHCGQERWGQPIDAFVQALRTRGVQIAALLDHVEMYLPSADPWASNVVKQMRERNLPYYEPSPDGLKQLYRELRSYPRPRGMKIVVGLEFNNVARPEDLLLLPDFVCFCFGDVADMPGHSWGQRAAARIRQIGPKIRRSGKPGIINHPFRNRYWAYKDLLAAGQAPRMEQFITIDDVAPMVEAAREFDLSLELNMKDLADYEAPANRPILDLCMRATRLLVQCGAELSIGSDSHSIPPPTFSPAVLETISSAGVTMEHIRPTLRRLWLEGR